MITPLTKRQKNLYSDFFKDMTLNQINFDLGIRTDEESIKESIRNLIRTNRGERLFQPNIGSGINNFLFEHITPDVIVTIKDMISETIKTYEPRASVISIDVVASYDPNFLEVTIVFHVINNERPVTLNVMLERTR